MSDVVLGIPPAGMEGEGPLPKLRLWNSPEIPIYIQTNVQDPDRIRKALAFFGGTGIRFVPFENQDDVLVFEEAQGTCKSYIGRVGGKQPIWISPQCAPGEIAHEIMHALGFVHEQSRTDRDQFIQVMWENIEEGHKQNFERLPPEFMVVSGLEAFDFHSLMLYPKTMFGRNGQATMSPKQSDDEIDPLRELSVIDRARIMKAYERR